MSLRACMSPDEAQIERRTSTLIRRAHEIRALATIVRDCSMPGRAFDLERAERSLAKIESVARGDWEGDI